MTGSRDFPPAGIVFHYPPVYIDDMSDELTTIRTKVHKLVAGDTVFCVTGDRIVMDVNYDPTFGTWITWDDGERDSFPVDFSIYRVEAI
jgi:hypothetical protein